MNLPTRGSFAAPTCPHSSATGDSRPHDPQAREAALARARVLGRAYPLAKRLAEVLELEVPDLAAEAKALRQRIGAALASRADDQ